MAAFFHLAESFPGSSVLWRVSALHVRAQQYFVVFIHHILLTHPSVVRLGFFHFLAFINGTAVSKAVQVSVQVLVSGCLGDIPRSRIAMSLVGHV